VFRAGSISVVRAGEKAVMAARRGVRMVVTIAGDIIVAAAIIPVFIAMLIAVIVRAHGVMVVRPILGADEGRRQSGHGKGREGK
jgi:hypothetical protein